MTPCPCVIFSVIPIYFEFTRKLRQQEKQRKLKIGRNEKMCHDY